jgi:general secretion pathway protein A
MSYYKVFGLEKEPFSTSPDPEFFYHSVSHTAALKRLEIAIRLRRGLSLVIGDVGIGKTTLSRALLGSFYGENDFIFHLILDPAQETEQQFLLNIVRVFGVSFSSLAPLDLKQSLEKYLFQKGVEEGKTVVLLVDEGQKLTAENLEVLRMFLNYETNEYKLLQLVILAQEEMLPRINGVTNFADRISMKYILNPLDEIETKKMIYFRLKKAGSFDPGRIFTDQAISLIYRYTQGYPRKIAKICHDALESAVMRDELCASAENIADLIEKNKQFIQSF